MPAGVVGMAAAEPAQTEIVVGQSSRTVVSAADSAFPAEHYY